MHFFSGEEILQSTHDIFSSCMDQLSSRGFRLQDKDRFLLTPFERNLEVWRQLWRVVERSHLIVQIVDARNPLKFRCEDLEAYVKDVEGAEGERGTGKGKRKSLLLINKADLLTSNQRCAKKDAKLFSAHSRIY
jgi:ribosome biogenesis GTPase A